MKNGVWFAIGIALGMLIMSTADAEEPTVFKAFPGEYGAMCLLDAPKYLEVNEYKEVHFWISEDGTHKWSVYENKENWLLAMHNVVNQVTCFFDKGVVDKES